jgi:hypothetical protein
LTPVKESARKISIRNTMLQRVPFFNIWTSTPASYCRWPLLAPSTMP